MSEMKLRRFRENLVQIFASFSCDDVTNVAPPEWLVLLHNENAVENRRTGIESNTRVSREKNSIWFGHSRRRQLSTFWQEAKLPSLDNKLGEKDLPTLQPIYEDLMRRNMPAKFRVAQNESVTSLGSLNLQLLRLKSLAGGTTIGLLKGRKVVDNGITYNIGRYGYAKTGEQTLTCSFTLTSNHTVWNLAYDDGAPVTEILFDCPASDVCCDLNCCSPAFPWWVIFLAFLSLIGIGIFVACIYTRCNEDSRVNANNPLTSRMISNVPKQERTDRL